MLGPDLNPWPDFPDLPEGRRTLYSFGYPDWYRYGWYKYKPHAYINKYGIFQIFELMFEIINGEGPLSPQSRHGIQIHNIYNLTKMVPCLPHYCASRWVVGNYMHVCKVIVCISLFSPNVIVDLWQQCLKHCAYISFHPFLNSRTTSWHCRWLVEFSWPVCPGLLWWF